MLDEKLLIDKAQAGNQDALNELISFFWHPVFRLISYKTGSPEDAQEITQETFVRAFRSLPHYQKTDAAFKTYLYRIALNLVTDFWRKKGRSPVIVEFSGCQQSATEDDQPDTRVVRNELQVEIAGALKELPDEQRKVIEFRIIAGLPIKETAITLHKTEAAIKMLQQRALKNLRTLLQTRGIIENCTRR